MAQFNPLEVPKLIPRVDTSPRDFRRELQTHGTRVKWELAAECPCQRKLQLSASEGDVLTTITQFTREKQRECPECKGSGWIRHSGQNIRALFTSMDRQPDRFAAYGGTYAKGVARVTTMPEHTPGFMDRLTMLDCTMSYTEITTRGEGTVDSVSYPVATRTMYVGTDADATVAETKQVGVFYCRKADGNGIVTGGELVAGEDLVVNEDGDIDWSLGLSNGTAPSEGERYSLQYFIHPVYVVKNFPYAIRASYTSSSVGGGTATGISGEQYVELPVLSEAWLEWLGD